jgi:glycosyltransferase involved in cell wall biosynthesis
MVPNGVDEDVFDGDGHPVQKDPLMVVCAARIEGIKNQLHLIRALNDTPYQLFLIGAHAPNQRGYYRECRKLASGNIHFTGRIPQQEVKAYYRRAKVHVLPSWFETTGLSSLEAAAMGCQVVITHYGDAHEYFSQDAFYCDPSSPASIRQAVEEAAAGGDTVSLRQRIHSHYTWEKATRKTYEAYRMVLHS